QLSGFTSKLPLLLVSMAGGNIVLLLVMTAIVSIILGMSLPTTVVYVTLAVLVGPALAQLGIVPLSAHLFLFYFGMLSLITPPDCLATYAAAAIAKSDFWRTGWVGMRLGIVAYIVPFVFVYHPALILRGGWLDIVAAVFTASLVVVLVDLEQRFRIMDRYEGYVQVLTLASPPIEALAGPDVTPELARLANDGMAELVANHPDRFPGFVASLPMNNPDASLREIDRAIDTLGATGVQIFSNVNGRPLDGPEWEPLFDRMAARRLPIWLHPARPAAFADYPGEKRSRYDIWWAFGWPYETTAAMARLVFAGLFDRHPDLAIITHHMGAMLPYFEGRAGGGLDQLGSRTEDPDDAVALARLGRRPLDYF